MFQEKYRDFYIRSVFDTPFGKWAVANGEEGEVILQYVPVESPSQSLINQYLSLNHPLLIPYLDVHCESGGLVFVRPYLLIENLIHRIPMDQETANLCCAQLADLEAYLKDQPIPMQILYHPENIGLTDEGELRVFLCGNESFMQWDFSNLKTFREILAGGEQKGEETEQEKKLQVTPPPPVRKPKPKVMVSRRGAVFAAIATGVLCFGAGLVVAGLGLMAMQKEETATVQTETSNQKTESPAPAPKPATDPVPSEDSTPTQEDIDLSRIVAEKFVSSLDRDDHQGILKKKARSMTVLPTMQAVRIDSRPGEITWRIEAEVFHSNGNMEGDMYRTTFRVVTVKENGEWQVKDAEVTEEVKE